MIGSFPIDRFNRQPCSSFAVQIWKLIRAQGPPGARRPRRQGAEQVGTSVSRPSL